MPRSTRIIVFAALGLVALVGLAIVAALFHVLSGTNLQERMQASAARALGMQVAIDGRVGFGLFPGLVITLEDVHLHSRASVVASAQEARLEIGLLPLLSNEVRIDKIVLKHAQVFIERERDNRLDHEDPNADAAMLPPPTNWPSVSASGLTFNYGDKELGEKVEAGPCDLDVQRLQHAGGSPAGFLKGLSFTAKLDCAQVRSERFTLSDLTTSVSAKDGVVDLRPLTTRAFGSLGSGDAQLDFSGATPTVHLHYSLTQFPIEAFFKAMSMQPVAVGRMDFSANLSMQGGSEKQMRQTAKGKISLHGKNLTLTSADLDREFARFEASQAFNLVDLGAVFFAGPFGLVVTRGFSLASQAHGAGGHSDIHVLVSDWTVDHGVAQAQDVAMATNHNRVALQGRLDFINDRFDGVTLALIDAKGCATLRQNVHGAFQAPVVDKPGFIESFAGPALRLLKEGSDLVAGESCKVFYSGSVAAPK